MKCKRSCARDGVQVVRRRGQGHGKVRMDDDAMDLHSQSRTQAVGKRGQRHGT